MQIQERYIVLFSIIFIITLIIAIVLIGKKSNQPQEVVSHIPTSTQTIYFNNQAVFPGFTKNLDKSLGIIVATLKSVYQKDDATYATISLDTTNPSNTNTIMLLSGNAKLDGFNIETHRLPELVYRAGTKHIVVNHKDVIPTLKKYLGKKIVLYLHFLPSTTYDTDPIYTQKDKEGYTCNQIFFTMVQEKALNKITCVPYVQQIAIYAED